MYAAVERDVEAIRHLSPKRPVNPVLLDDAGLRTQLDAHSAEDNPPAVLARQGRLLKALGILPADADLGAIMHAFQAGQIAGFYRPSDGQLYVVSRGGGLGAAERTTFAHEYTHALQDQNFALLQQVGAASGGPLNGDRDLARLALIEGDATLVMTLWAQDHLSALDLVGMLQSSLDPAQQAALAAMPPFLRDSALFPYTAGVTLATSLETNGGWPAVDAAFRAPPESTEQVLHPEKYAAHEPPETETLPADLAAQMGAGWTVDAEDTLGEFQIRTWLMAAGASRPTPASAVPGTSAATATSAVTGISAASARTAAEGWGGDRVALLAGPNGGWALALRTIWDTDRDALEFSNAAAIVAGAPGRNGLVAPGVWPREVWVFLASSPDFVPLIERAATGP